MPSSLVRAGMFVGAIAVLPAIGIPFYTWRASEAIVPYQIQAWKDLGYEITHSPAETHYFGFRVILPNVQGTGRDGKSFTVNEMDVPLLPWMSLRMDRVNFVLTTQGTLNADRIEGTFRRGTAEGLTLTNLAVREAGQETFRVQTANVERVNWTNTRMDGITLTRPSVESPNTVSAQAQTATIRHWDWSAGAVGFKGVSIRDIEVNVNPSRNSPLLAQRGQNSMRITSLDFDTEGDASRQSAASLSMTGIRWAQNVRGANLQTRMRRTTEGRSWILEVGDDVMTRAALELNWPVRRPQSDLFSPPEQTTDIRGVLELTDPNGFMREYVRQLATMNGVRRGQEDNFLSSFLTSQGMLNQEGSAAIVSWFRNPSRTLTVNFENPSRGNIRLAARLKN